MIAYMKGQLADMGADWIIVENQGIGYRIFVPVNVPGMLPDLGEKIKIYTYMHVREDAMQLFGFMKHADLEMFRLLITVNGIGPKGALGILSVLSAQDLKFAILAGDVKTISSAPGVGKKTAEKMVLELKDKVKLEDAFEEKLQEEKEAKDVANSAAKQDAIEALVALGYSQTEALKAVRQVELTADMTANAVLKLALKNLSF